jgi:hypothetical protein
MSTFVEICTIKNKNKPDPAQLQTLWPYREITKEHQNHMMLSF